MCHYLVAFAQTGHAGAGRCDRPGRLRPERHRSRPPICQLPILTSSFQLPMPAATTSMTEGSGAGARSFLWILRTLREPS
jgi:hypothetical protein